MYFVKARKQLEEQDATNLERIMRDRYQRSDSTRLLVQALPQNQMPRQASQTLTSQDSIQDQQRFTSTSSQSSKPSQMASGSAARLSEDFRPEDLPDGACYRPKKEIQLSNGRPMSPGAGPSDRETTTTDVTRSSSTAQSKEKIMTEQVRSAQYVGTFSVSGSDKKAREKQMEQQLQDMKAVEDVTPVRLIISQEGVKVMHESYGTRIMEHSLKRIWYATCDPESCQFSFLAREPKTSAEVQYCHAFLTKTAQEAEDLISIMSDAFKSTGPGGSAAPAPSAPEAKKQPTFHELIEQQVQQQQAKFREIEKEAKVALQQKLTEIATPTPFSGVVMHRMGQRRMSSDEAELMTQKNRMWAKQLISQQHSHPASTRLENTNWNNRRSEIPLRLSTPQSSPSKRNSVPASVGENSFGSSITSVPSSPAHPLSALAIKESVQSSTKFKGSPVTALKNEIDKRLVMEDSSEPLKDRPMKQSPSYAKDKIPPKPSMANRPLPSPPGSSGQEPRSKAKGGRALAVRERHSFDDNSLPQGSPEKVKMRNSPRRGTPRPMSEIAVSSSHFQQQRQSLLQNFASSFNNTAELEAAGYDTPLMYAPQVPPPTSASNPGISSRSSAADVRERDGRKDRDRSKGRDGGRKGREEPLPPPPQPSPQDDVYEVVRDDSSQSPSSPQHAKEQEVLRYQNGSPFYAGGADGNYCGFESLMGLDRSHIHDITLRNAPWYQAGLAREIALEILQQEEVGCFIVRDSSTHPGCYALSVRVPKFENSSGISHYLILRTHRGVKLKGLDKEWSNLNALVTHHTVMREMLPCTLRLPKTSATVSQDASQPGKEESKGENFSSHISAGLKPTKK